jgi:hypothetical protein
MAGHVAYMGELESSYKILVGKPEGKLFSSLPCPE